MEYSHAEREAVLEQFEAFLNRLDADDRQPDRWEEDCLTYAISAMTSDMYRLAAVEIKIASTPPHERSPDSVRALNVRPARFTKDIFRRALTFLRAFDPD